MIHKHFKTGEYRRGFKMNFAGLVLTAILSVFILKLEAQTNYRLNSATSTITVTGTSTLHDWEMSLKEMNCLATLKSNLVAFDEVLKFDFTAKSDNLKSESAMMDDKAHDALKTKQFPTFSFHADAIKITPGNTKDISGTVVGNLTIAGVSKKIQMQFSGTYVNGTDIVVKGKMPLKMTDFGVTPPKLMMGTLKTGDDIAINFSLEFKKE